MMNAAASTWPKPSGKGMHRAAGASVWVPKPPVPDRQATFWPTFRCVTPSPSAAITPAYSDPGTKGRGGFIWYLFCTCLLYTSDAADERSSVDLGGRRIIKKKK